MKTLETQLVLSVDVWKAIWSDSKNLLNVAGKKQAPGEVPSTSESILMTLLLLQKVALNEVRIHFPILASPNRARFDIAVDIVMENRDLFLDGLDDLNCQRRKLDAKAIATLVTVL